MADAGLSPEAQSILEAAPPNFDQEFLRNMAKRDTQRDNLYKLCEDYYTSENQRVKLTDRLKTFLNQSGLLFCENFCEVVVDVLSEKLILERLDTDVSAAAAWADDAWKYNRMDELQAIIHRNTTMKGDGFVIVDLDSKYQRARVNWNRPEIIKPIYDSEYPDQMILAAKVWESKLETPTNPNKLPVWRMNLYFPDRCEKWFNTAQDKGGDWARHLDNGDEAWPIPWVDENDEPLGVPVFHFRNKAIGRAFGISEIRSTIPQQDGFNKAVVDLATVIDTAGQPNRWGTGIKSGDNIISSTGNAGTTWRTANEGARFGQFEIPDISKLLSSLEAQLQRIAGRSRTPLFLLVLSGDAPSGESLKTAYIGLTEKAQDRMKFHGSTWEDAYVMAAKVDQVYGGELAGVDIEADMFTAVWKDPTPRNERDEREGLKVAVDSLGLSKRTALSELGYDPDEEKDYKDEEASAVVTNFDRGLPIGPVAPVTPIAPAA